MNCSELTAGLIAAQCGQLETAGASGEVILIDFNTVDRADSTVTNNIISAIELLTGKYAYKFETFDRSLDEAGATFARGTYRNTFTHSVPLRIFVKTEGAKAFVNNLASGVKVIAILKNKATGVAGEVKYEAYGWDNGLEVSESAPTIAMADGVVYPLTLASTDTAQEGSLPKSVWVSTLAATETMLAGLFPTAPVEPD
ncbi:MAG: hypothetical protein LBS50_11260 [Prevotellaceae bacterium]|jgi:hypothetical protein|nr:hypothetical protein [Prevotellaceae bacterium]